MLASVTRSTRVRFSLMSLAVAGFVGLVLGRAATPRTALFLLGMLASATFCLVVINRAGTATLMLLVMASAAFTTTMNDLHVGSVLTVADLFLAIALGLAGASRLIHPSRTSMAAYRPFFLATAAIFLGGLVGSFFASNFSLGILELMRFGVSTTGVMMVVALWGPGRRELRVLTWAFASGTATSVVFGMVNDGAGRLRGLTIHPNHLGMACVLAFGAAVGLALTSTPGKPRTFASGLCLLLSAGVVLSGSRAALAAWLVSVLVVLFITRNRRLARVATLFTVLAAAALLLGVVHLPATNAVTRAAGDPTAQAADEQRAAYLAVTLERIDAHPFTGSGFNYATQAHSVYLQVLDSAGVIGLLAYLGIVALVLRIASRARQAHDYWLAGLAASCVGFFAAATVSNLFWDRWLWVYLSLVVALSATSAGPHSGGADSMSNRLTGDAERVPVRRSIESRA